MSPAPDAAVEHRRSAAGDHAGGEHALVGATGLPAPEPKGRRAVIRATALVAIVATAAYLGWRVGFTVRQSLWLAIPLWLLELHALVGLGLFTFSLWDLDAAPRPPPRDARRAVADLRVALLIPTYDEPAEVLLPTVAAAVALAPARWRRGLFRPGLWLGIAITALVYAHATLDILPLPGRLDPVARLGGYPHLAARLLAMAPKPPFLATDSYGAAALLDFLSPQCPHLVAVGPRWRYFALPDAAPSLAGRTGLLLRDTRRHNRPDREGWAWVAAGPVIARHWQGEVVGSYQLWQVRAGTPPPVAAIMPCRPGAAASAQ